jgi:hypothetical protein
LLTNDAELNGPLKAEVIAAATAISRDLGQQIEPHELGPNGPNLQANRQSAV